MTLAWLFFTEALRAMSSPSVELWVGTSWRPAR